MSLLAWPRDSAGADGAAPGSAATAATAGTPGPAAAPVAAPAAPSTTGGVALPEVPDSTSATPAVIAEPVPLPPGSPELKTQETLRAYLAVVDPKRLDSLTMLKLDRAQITDRMGVLAKTGEADELVDAYLYYLTALVPDRDTYLNVMARLALLLNDRNTDAGLLTLLFQEALRYDPNAPQVVQIQLAQAEYLLRAGLPQPALVLLHRVANQPGIAPAARVLAIGRAGFLHERVGQPEEALDAYLQTEQDLAVVPQASEAMVRAGLLLLDLGREDEAIKVFQKLQAVPPEVLRESSAGSAVAEMLQLTADPAAAKAYWSHQDKWFPLWQKLASSLGVGPDAPVQVIGPSIDDYQRLTMEGSLALSDKNRDQYFQVVNLLLRSARWRPSDLADGANLLYQGLRLAPDRANDFLALGVAMEEGLPPQEKNVAKQLAQLRVGTLVEVGQADQGRELAATSLAKYGADGMQGEALVRLYGFAVVRSNTENSAEGAEAIRFLSESLNDPDAHGHQRPLAIEVLCDMYLALGREDDAQALLQKELAAPPRDSTGGASYQAALRQSLDQLQQRHAQVAGMDTALSTWWGKYAVPWYAYATTAPQAGPLSTVDDPAVQVARQFSHALDPVEAASTRASTLIDAWSPYPEMPLTGSAVVAAAADFAGRTELPDQLRYVAWAKTMWHLLWTGQRDAAEKLLTAAPASAQTTDDRPSLDLWIEYLGLPQEVAAQQAFADKVLAQPKLNRFGLVLVVRVIESLARLGSFDAAEAEFKKLQSAGMDDSATEQFNDLKDNMEPLIAQYRATQPAYEALRTLVLKAEVSAAAAAQLPARWRDLNDAEQPDLDLLTQDEASEGLLTVIRDRLAYGRHPLQVFLDYGEALPVDAANNTLRFQIFQTAQQQVTRDDDRFYAAMFSEMVDFDDMDVARRGWEAMSADRVAATYPKTADFLQYYSTLMAWRLGGPVDMAAAFGPLDAPTLDGYKLRMALEFYVQQRDQAALQKLLQQRPEADFLKMPVLSVYIKALRLLGLEAKLTRASDSAQLELSKAVVQSWARPEREQIEPVFELAEALQNPAAYPRAWVDFLLAQVRNENTRDLVRIEDARVQQDWAAELEAANSFLERNPTQYDYYWAKANALVQLGRPVEAVAPLRVYVKYSHNDADYPAAVELLKKIETAPPAPVPAAASNGH
jgi:tetratricopeptide (TPR) repeat protein